MAHCGLEPVLPSTPRRRRTRRQPAAPFLLFTAVSLFGTGCAEFFGDDEGKMVGLNPNSSFADATAGEPVEEILEVQLLDRQGYPRPGVEVVWRVQEGGGMADPSTTITDEDGVTSTRWILGTDQEYQKLIAKAPKSRPYHFQAYAAGADSPGSTETGGGGEESGGGGESSSDDSGGISPARVAFTEVGESHALTVTLPDGSVPAADVVQWSSSAPGVVSIDAKGVAVALALGAVTITARVAAPDWSGSADYTATSEITSHAVGPDGLILHDSFDQYGSTGHMLNDPFDFYSEHEDKNPARIAFDPSESFGAGGGSMRYDFPDRSGSDRRCNDYTIGRNVAFPVELREVWVELRVKFSREWDTVAPSEWKCGSNPDYKLLGGRVKHWDGSTSGAYRFGLLNGNGYGRRWLWSDPEDDHTWADPDGDAIWDGQWHTIRVWMRTSSSPDAPDGGSAVWLDGVLVTHKAGTVVNRRGVYGIYLGRNINQGPSQPQSIWWDDVRVWAKKPAWDNS